MALSADEIINLTRHTLMDYNLEEKHSENIKRIFETQWQSAILCITLRIIHKKLFNIKGW